MLGAAVRRVRSAIRDGRHRGTALAEGYGHDPIARKRRRSATSCQLGLPSREPGSFVGILGSLVNSAGSFVALWRARGFVCPDFCAIRYITITYESIYATFLGFRCTIRNGSTVLLHYTHQLSGSVAPYATLSAASVGDHKFSLWRKAGGKAAPSRAHPVFWDWWRLGGLADWSGVGSRAGTVSAAEEVREGGVPRSPRTERLKRAVSPAPLLGIAGAAKAPTYAELYSGEWTHPTGSGCLR